MSILFGADRLVREPWLSGKIRRAALVTNDAARLAANPDVRSRSALIEAGIPLVRLFSLEHGLSARAADGAAIGDGWDDVTGLPVTSLYGGTLSPPPEAMADLDCVFFDVPDAGARFYTYLWTLTHVIDACARAGKPCYVLDRPNPLGGLLESVEGPIAQPAHYSFLARHSIPVRHSLTYGEVAELWRTERCPTADVHIVACSGWRRADLHDPCATRFVSPSPAINSFAACLFYPGLCVFEATNLSVGRGDPLSFTVVGAPWLDVDAVASKFRDRQLPGIDVETTMIQPKTGPYSGAGFQALHLLASEPERVRPVAAGLALLADVIARHPREFEWALYPTAANPTGTHHFERLMGVDGIREQLVRGADAVNDAMLAEWTSAPEWAERWCAVQIYE